MIAFPVAFVIDLATDWVGGVRFANRLVRGGQRVLVVTRVLASPPGEVPLPLGSLVVPLNRELDPGLVAPPDADELRDMAADVGVDLRPLDAGHRLVAAPLVPVVAGLYGGGGAPFDQASVAAECGFAVRFIDDAEIRAGGLDAFDVLIMPGGGFRAMHGQLEPLGETGCRAIADWVRRGGMYVGSCAGSYDCVVAPDDFVASCPAQRHLQLVNVRVWNDASIDFGALQSPGIGVLTVRNERPDHPVMFGLPDRFDIVHYNGPIFDPVPIGTIDGASAATGLASFAGWTERFTPAEDFAGPRADPDPTLLERAIAAGRYSAVAGHLGLGRVVAFGSHPEFGTDSMMIRWSLPARLLVNAVVWQAASRPAFAPRDAPPPRPGPVALPAGGGFAAVPAAMAAVRDRATALMARPIDPPPPWLAPAYALSFFGDPPAAIWRRALDDIVTMSAEIGEYAERVRQQVASVFAAHAGEEEHASLLATVALVERWVLDERPEEWGQDGGYQGVLALLGTAARMCDAALADWDVALGPPAGAYAYLHDNPYHLVAGSYLAAIGCVAGAYQLLRAAGAELDMALQLAADNDRFTTRTTNTTGAFAAGAVTR